MRVLVLRNRVKEIDEDQDMERLITHIAQCLQQKGHEAMTAVCNSLQEVEAMTEEVKPQAVFNMVESLQGSDAHAYLALGVLEMKKIPYTGCPPEAFLLTCDKQLTKRMLVANGIPTPPSHGDGSGYAGRYIVKSITEHASLGLEEDSVVENDTQIAALIAAKKKQWGGEWFAEAYVEGREMNVSLLQTAEGVEVLPPAEIVFKDYPVGKPRILDRFAKWKEDSFAYQHTVREYLPAGDPLVERLGEIARQCWDAFCFRSYARVDFRVDAAGNPYVIDLNTNPCLENDAGFLAAIRQSGRTELDLFNHLVERAVAV